MSKSQQRKARAAKKQNLGAVTKDSAPKQRTGQAAAKGGSRNDKSAKHRRSPSSIRLAKNQTVRHEQRALAPRVPSQNAMTVPAPKGVFRSGLAKPSQKPSAAYLAAVSIVSSTRTILNYSKPQLVILDINGTLCVRPIRNAAGAVLAQPRPFVSTLLEYLLSPTTQPDGSLQPRFAVMVRCLSSGS